MQILASALPGFRDLRAPLTAGYLWLLLVWIMVKPHPTTKPTNEIAGSLYDLGKAAGPIWIGLAISVTAYLIGSVSQSFSTALYRRTSRLARKFEFRGSRIESRKLARVVNKYQTEAAVRLSMDPESEIVKRNCDIARVGLQEELEMPTTLLLGQQPELFSEADRLKAEAQLRLTIVLPALAVTIYLIIEHSSWWATLLLVIGAIAWEGHRRSSESRQMIVNAVEFGLVRSPSLDELKEWVESLKSLPSNVLISPSPRTKPDDESGPSSGR